MFGEQDCWQPSYKQTSCKLHMFGLVTAFDFSFEVQEAW